MGGELERVSGWVWRGGGERNEEAYLRELSCLAVVFRAMNLRIQ